MRSFANIFLQIYPGLILIGNLGEILRFISCKIIFCGINVSEEKKVFICQIIYLLFMFLFLILDVFCFVDENTFDDEKTLLFMKEKVKLLYLNSILGGIINIIEIIYLIILLVKEKKYKIDLQEKKEMSLIRFEEEV